MPAPKTVIYVANDGSEVLREGGSRAWRNNNQGNIEKGGFAAAHGAIGGDSRFAIFPDAETGLLAIVALLQGPSYRGLTLEQAINRYAPPNENNTAGYVEFVATRTGIAPDTVLGALEDEQVRSIAEAIKVIEGWIEGSERENVTVGGAADMEVPLVSAAVVAEEWMVIAEREAALPEHERSEWPDPGENPRIINYFAVAAPWFDPAAGDEVDWCAAFVNYCLETAGFSGTTHPGARSFFWNKQNRFLEVEQPVPGCVVVFRRPPFDDPEWETGPGHVGFVVGSDANTVTVLGGNQDKMIKRKAFPWEARDAAGNVTLKIVGFRIPVMN